MAGWLAPVGAQRGTPFGAAGHLWASGRHTGQDFLCPSGTPVHSCAAGRVIYAGNTHGSYGIQVKVRHRAGLETWYCHLSSLAVQAGDTVGAGALLGHSGATGNVTGPHLHLEFRVNGIAVDPVPFLDGKKGDPPTVRDAAGLIPPPGQGAGSSSSDSGSGSGSSGAWTGSTKAGRSGDSGDSGGADATDAADTNAKAMAAGLRGLTLETLIVVGGFGLVAVGALYAALPAVKKAATAAADLTPEGAALGAAKGTS